MRNAQVVQVMQTSGYSRQLLLRRTRRLMDREGAGMSTSISLCTLGSFLRYCRRSRLAIHSYTMLNGCASVDHPPTKGTTFWCERRLFVWSSL